MRMSTAVVNGSDAENHDHKQNHSDMVSTHFGSSKMKSIPSQETESDTKPSVSEIDGENNDELSQMKGLMLKHLDMIQQQSERILQNEKVIEHLTLQNEKMKQRVERMERRVSLQKTRGDKKHGQGAESSDGGGRKRRPVDRSSSPAHTGRKPYAESAGKRTRSEGTSSKRIKQEPDENENEPEINMECKLTCIIPYFTCVGEEQLWMLNQALRLKDRIKIEVPLWRQKGYTSSYTMEGTENLSDDAFDRRHQKFLGDEKKRKRWDVQRIREQRQCEKLKSRSDKTMEISKSLWPQPTEGSGTRLTVGSLIPVSVFGITLPATPVQDFALPWKEGMRNRKKGKR